MSNLDHWFKIHQAGSRVLARSFEPILAEATSGDYLPLHLAIADLNAPTFVVLESMPDDVLQRAYTYWQVITDVEGCHLLINAWCADAYLGERVRDSLAAQICQFVQVLLERVEIEVFQRETFRGEGHERA